MKRYVSTPSVPQPHNPTTPQPHNPTTPQPHNPTTPQPKPAIAPILIADSKAEDPEKIQLQMNVTKRINPAFERYKRDNSFRKALRQIDRERSFQKLPPLGPPEPFCYYGVVYRDGVVLITYLETSYRNLRGCLTGLAGLVHAYCESPYLLKQATRQQLEAIN